MTGKMTRIDAAQNMSRFWELSVQPGLFGDYCVTRFWGRNGTGGQSTERWFAAEEAAEGWAGRMTRLKIQRGYVSVGRTTKVAG